MSLRLIALGIALVVLLWFTFPRLSSLAVSIVRPSEEITISSTSDSPDASSLSDTQALDTDKDGEVTFKIVTLLGPDSIRSIDSPKFVSADEADEWMQPDEQVLALSINGEHKAYSIPQLSRHEIVNDVVGGIPVAVTW